MLPTEPTKNPIGHTIVANIKKIGSSIPLFKIILNKPEARLCNTTNTKNPTAEIPVSNRNFLKIPSILFLRVRAVNTAPKIKKMAHSEKAMAGNNISLMPGTNIPINIKTKIPTNNENVILMDRLTIFHSTRKPCLTVGRRLLGDFLSARPTDDACPVVKRSFYCLGLESGLLN